MNGAEETQVALSWEPLLSGGALWAFGAVVLVALWLGWRSSAGLRPGRRGALLALRLAAVALLAFVLAGPSRVTTTGRVTRDPFVILLDSSRSMRTLDADGRTRAAAVGEWLAEKQPDLARLAEDVDVRYVLFDEALSAWGGGGDGPSDLGAAPPTGGDQGAAGGGGPSSGEPVPADGQGTDVGSALFSLPDVLGGARPAGVLLVSDGADRSTLGRAFDSEGAEGVKRLISSVRYPVSTWTVGDGAGAADLAITGVDAPPFGFVRRPLTVTAHLRNRSLPSEAHQVALRGDGELLAAQQISVPNGEEIEVTFEVKPDEIGYHTYSVEVPVPRGDTIPTNNRLEFTVKVVRDRTRVLQVTSRPSWDVKFLRRLLKTDPNIDLVSFFILRSSRDGSLAARGRPFSLIEFPYRELFSTDLEGFDLVIFQNFAFNSFSNIPERPIHDALAKFVADGGAFLMVGGDVSFASGRYDRSALSAVMPTTMPDTPLLTHPFKATLTDVGLRHPLTRLTRDPAENPARWEALPALQGLNPLGDLAPGAVSLVEDEEGRTAVAVRNVGRGRTMAVATDTTWNWALAGMGGQGAGQDHATFWRNAVRWLVKDVEQKQVQIITDKENYRLGETIQAQVTVLTDDYSPRANVDVTGVVMPVGGGEPRAFSGVTDATGQVAVSLPTPEEGTLRISAEVPAIQGEYGQGEVRVSVSDRQGELEDPSPRPALMAAIAEATGGEVLDPRPDPRRATRRPVDALLATERSVESLWAHPLLLLLLVVPLGAEWVLRRRMGLR